MQCCHDRVSRHLSGKHLQWYVREFEWRHNVRPLDTEEQMATMEARAVGKHPPYASLIGPEHTKPEGI